MAFNDTYRESIQQKHVGNVGFTSTAKEITNEAYALKNPHQVLANQIPVIDVVGEHGPLVASGIAAGLVEKHTVKLTADPTVNNNLAWIAYEDDCTEAGHSSRGHIRLDMWMRVAETQYKLRLFADNGSNAPDYSTEILPSDTNFNWEYDASAGTVYFDSDPSAVYNTPLWGEFYKYIGETLYDKVDTTTSGVPVTDAFGHITDGTNTADASGSDTITFSAQGGASVTVDPVTKTVTYSGIEPVELVDVDLTYNAGSGNWEYSGANLTSVPSDLQVFLNGNKNKKDPEYYTASVNSGTLVIDFAFDTYVEDWVNATWSNPTTNGTGGSGTGGMNDWEEIITNANVEDKDRIIVNTSSTGSNDTPYTLTLPASPSIGAMIGFLDGAGHCGTTNVTIARNGSNIMGAASDLVIDTDNASFYLVYYNATEGWRVFD